MVYLSHVQYFFTFKLNCIELFWLKNIFSCFAWRSFSFSGNCVHLLPRIPGNFPLYGISSPTFSQVGIPSSLLSLQQIMLNPFLFIKNKQLFTVYPQRVSPPLKKLRDMFSGGNAAHPVGCDSLCR